MKSLFYIFLISLLHVTVSAQHSVLSFSEAEDHGLSIQKIDTEYKSAIHTQSEKAVFTEKADQFTEEYKLFIFDLARELNENGFYWDEPTRVFTRVYFSKDGRVDHFFYNNEHAGLGESEQQRFNTIVDNYISDKSLSIGGTEPFAQCSPVVYSDVMEKE